jgi:hypothetical protein
MRSSNAEQKPGAVNVQNVQDQATKKRSVAIERIQDSE